MRRALVVACVLGASASAPGAIDVAPVAVMPFRNLNNDADTEWLRVGIAETMVSDLKKAGVGVVERDQVDRVLGELALQSAVDTDSSTAVKLGKLVGARTVVVGAFQKAGSQIRITARFVGVESGVVRDTGKVTGPLAKIFSLQDDIVGKLVGKPPPPRRRAKPAAAPTGDKARAPSEQDTLAAYRLYSLSLQTSSQADRVRFLKDAIELDPTFEYAVEDLEELQRRIEGYQERADQVQERQRERGLAALDDTSTPGPERAVVAMQLMQSHVMGFRYRELLLVAERVYRMDLPPAYGTVDVRELASYYVVLSHQQLRQHDLMLQAGERHLKEFPGGQYFGSVSMLLQSQIQQRRMHAGGGEKARQKIDEIEGERVELLADDKTLPYRAVRIRSLDYQRCAAGTSHSAYDVVLEECARFLATHGESDDPDAKSMIDSARYWMINAYVESGRFSEARKSAKRWLEDDAEAANRHSIPVLMTTWPRE